MVASANAESFVPRLLDELICGVNVTSFCVIGVGQGCGQWEEFNGGVHGMVFGIEVIIAGSEGFHILSLAGEWFVDDDLVKADVVGFHAEVKHLLSFGFGVAVGVVLKSCHFHEIQ